MSNADLADYKPTRAQQHARETARVAHPVPPLPVPAMPQVDVRIAGDGPDGLRDGFGKRLRRRLSRFFGRYVFTSLTQRILFLNLAALVVLVSGILYLNQFRDSLIEARVESLLTQGEIIAGAIAASATVETDSIQIDPDKLLELQAGESTVPVENDDNLDFPINPEQVAPVLRRLISPTRTRARIYDRDGLIILDSKRLYSKGQILRFDLPPLQPQKTNFFKSAYYAFIQWFQRSDLPVYREYPGGNGTAYREVVKALTGGPASETRTTESGNLIVSVAVPIQRFRAVLGVLLLSTESGAIDKIVRNERMAIVRVFLVAAAVTIVLSILLASTIARPLHRLAAAADRVRQGIKSREEIPDFSDRQDEIGHLSKALGEMTASMYDRIEAIESFAADVAHELKNPLTSLRSAVETLPLVRNDEQRKRLLDIIFHDVHRLNRLISDISNASRLDAELAREATRPIDLARLLRDIHDTSLQVTAARGRAAAGPELRLNISAAIETPLLPGPTGGRNSRMRTGIFVSGHDGRLGQVIVNLVDNAKSFVPEIGGWILIDLKTEGRFAVITVSDNGPGIPPENTKQIFERFYTDRPEGEAFGQNSGLGLSITRQIVEAHDGTITAENRIEDGQVAGAVFTVRLPLLST